MATTDKPSKTEEDYFAAEEIEKKRKLAVRQADDLAAKQKRELKALHFLKCPKCGMDLHTLKKGKIEVDACFNCHGLWLDSGELEALVAEGGRAPGAWTRAVINLFRHK